MAEMIEVSPVDPGFAASVAIRSAEGSDNAEIVLAVPCQGFLRVTHRIVMPAPQLLAALEGWLAERERSPRPSGHLQ